MSRSLYVAWRAGTHEQGRWGPVGRLDYVDSVYSFIYTQGARTLPGFVPFAGMDDLDEVYESDTLFPLFANRLLARSRPEYQAYLTWGGFDYRDLPDPLAILGVTEGRRMTDAVEIFPCPRPDQHGRYSCVFFLHGVRHLTASALERIADMKTGMALTLFPEPVNLEDPNAVAVYSAGTADGIRIGYVPRFLARDARQLLGSLPAEEIKLTVRKLNLNAPLQQRLLCNLSAPWPANFAPCAGDEFQPIAASMTELAA